MAGCIESRRSSGEDELVSGNADTKIILESKKVVTVMYYRDIGNERLFRRKQKTRTRLNDITTKSETQSID